MRRIPFEQETPCAGAEDDVGREVEVIEIGGPEPPPDEPWNALNAFAFGSALKLPPPQVLVE